MNSVIWLAARPINDKLSWKDEMPTNNSFLLWQLQTISGILEPPALNEPVYVIYHYIT